jgi:hypothetical protein
MRTSLLSSSARCALAVAISMACMSCGSKEAPREPTDEKRAPSCASLLGSWSEVEPTDGTTVDEPDPAKVRATGTRLDVERGRLTIASGVERVYSSMVLEPVSDGRCVLRARDSLGRPLEIDVTFVSERLMRLHNVLEPKSPATLFERR